MSDTAIHGDRPDGHALPDEIPLFPLPGALLLPEGVLPLNVFEPRYLSMVDDALGRGRFIGMIQPLDGEETTTDAANHPALYPVGCLGRISTFSEASNGRYLITLSGVGRFRLVEETGITRGYRRARVDFSPFAADRGQALDIGVDRARLLDSLRRYMDSADLSGDWSAISKAGDSALVTTLAMMCPFEVREKQALLECPGMTERASLLIDLMDMAAMGAAGGPRH